MVPGEQPACTEPRTLANADLRNTPSTHTLQATAQVPDARLRLLPGGDQQAIARGCKMRNLVEGER
jgi:hypothetical protein